MIRVEINEQRLLDELSELSEIGLDAGGGVTRLAYTQADRRGREWFIKKATRAGLELTVDPIGNIFALEASNARCRQPVLSGSHLDTVTNGGRFDGALGVLTALEAVRSIRSTIPLSRRRHPVGVLVLAAEESTRFGVGCIGSRTLVADLHENALTELRDSQRITLFQALKEAGLHPGDLSKVRRDPGWFHEFVEVHIDQGKDLLQAGFPLGIVTAIAAPTRLWIRIKGQAAHSGATLMHERRDALTGAAEMVLAVEEIAQRHASRGIVGTVGVLNVAPGAMNTIPGLVEAGVDIRGTDSTSLESVKALVIDAVQHVAKSRDLTVEVSTTWNMQPVRIDEERVARLVRSCQLVGCANTRVVSRSGHDSMYLARHGPASMLFVRNVGGVSHEPKEMAQEKDSCLAATVLATYMASVAQH